MNKYQSALKRIKQETAPNTYCEDFNKEECINVLQELVDKATPKKLVRYDFSKEWHCSNCDSGNGEYEGTVGTHNYCHYCGQALDWSDKNEKEN